MDVQLKELIDKIRDDGVKIAEEKASQIISDAKIQANSILKEAQKEAGITRKTAQADAEKAERIGREALQMAARDLLLSVKTDIERIFSKVISDRVASSLDPSVLKDIIVLAVRSLVSNGESAELEIGISERDLAHLEADLKSSLSEEFSKGLEVKPCGNLNAGFRVSRKDGSVFYDFTEREIASVLSRYMNPKLAEMLME